jgi:hypothetical protein
VVLKFLEAKDSLTLSHLSLAADREFLLPASGRHAQIFKTFETVEMIASGEN